MLTQEQQNELFDIMINDNDFVLYALFQIENRHAQNLQKEYTLMKEAFDNFEKNMKEVFGIDFSFKEQYHNLTVDDLKNNTTNLR